MMILGISGAKGSGKSTLAKALLTRHPGRSINFADPLKVLVQQYYHATAWQTDGTDDEKQALLPCGLSVRGVLQRLGQAMRDIDPDVWVRKWRERVVHTMHCEEPNRYLVVAADVRYPNELNAVKELGGSVIRLARSPLAADYHSSETALDNNAGDYELIVPADLSAASTIALCEEYVHSLLQPKGQPI